MIGFALLVAGIAVNAQLPQVAPPSFVATPGQKFYLDLDTVEGKLSQWRHDDLGTLTAVHATLRVPTIRQDPRWAPTFMIAVQNTEPGRFYNNMVALQILSRDRKPPFSLRVAKVDAGKIMHTDPFYKEIGLDQPVEVEIDWATRNLVVVTVGSETKKVQIDWPVDNVTITSSTGQLKGDPVVFGQMGK